MSSIVYYKSEDHKLSIVCGRGVSNRFPTHRHKSFSLGMVLKGSRMLTILRSKYIIAEGDVFIINSNESHSIGETLNPEHDYIVLSLSSTLFSDHCGSDLTVFENIVESILLSENLERLFHALIKKNDGIKNFDISLLLEEMCHFKKNEIPTQLQDNRLEKVKDLLDHTLTENISLNSLSDKAAVSKFHLARLFKNYTGMAPHQYLLDNRLRCAREMLESGLLISDIAIAAGFYDTSHFIRHFLNYFGVSPFDFQKGINNLIIE
jgi:AraC-like DNA-binding protein